jgi:hypothetical protein
VKALMWDEANSRSFFKNLTGSFNKERRMTTPTARQRFQRLTSKHSSIHGEETPMMLLRVSHKSEEDSETVESIKLSKKQVDEGELVCTLLAGNYFGQ